MASDGHSKMAATPDSCLQFPYQKLRSPYIELSVQDSFVNQWQSRLKKNPDSTYRNPGLQFVEHSVRAKVFPKCNAPPHN